MKELQQRIGRLALLLRFLSKETIEVSCISNVCTRMRVSFGQNNVRKFLALKQVLAHLSILSK